MYNFNMLKQESFYKNSPVVTLRKKILPYLLDYFLTLILSLLLYVGVNAIGETLPYFKNIQSEASSIQLDLYSLVNDSGIRHQGEDGILVTSEYKLEKIIKEEVLYSLKINNNANSNSAIYDGFEALDLNNKEHNNGIYYYFINYKVNNLNLYNEEYKVKDYGIDFYLNEIVKLKENNYFEQGLYVNDLNYPLIKYDIAIAIDEYYRNSNYKIGSDYYNEIYSLYYSGINKAMNDLIYGNTSYISLNNKHNELVNEMLNFRGNALLISYLLSVIIIYLIFPLILKEGRTIGLRVFKLVSIDINGNKVSILNNLIRMIVSIFSVFSLLIIDIFLLFGTQAMYFFNINLLGFINIFVLSLISLIFNLISIAFTFINKNRHQNIEETLAMIVVVDGDEFIVNNNKEKEVIDEKK